MKTSTVRWGIAALVVALLTLGVLFVASHSVISAPQQANAQAAAGNPPAADNKVNAFLAKLRSDGFIVQEGRLVVVPFLQLCCIPNPQLTCSFFNQASPYQAAYLPLSPGQTTQELPWMRVPEYPDLAPQWRLRPDEAVVFVGLTPPPVRYFGFQSYRFLTVDELGNRVRKWNNFGDQTNQLVINTAGTPNGAPGNPFSSLTIRITTADRGIDARVRAAAVKAGYPTSIMNTEPVPQSIVRMGLDEDADIFIYVLRAAMAQPGYEDALAQYKSDPPVRVFRVTPKTDAPVYPATSADPLPIPEFRIHGTGQTEYALLPAVRDLRKAILKKYESLNTTEVPTETQRLHTEQGWFYGLHHMVADNDGIAPSTDSLYLRTKESFGTLGEDEFVIVYGVNHHLTGKAMYENVTVYGLTHQVTADDVDDTQLAGSATDYLPATYPDVDKLYAYKFARHCDPGEEHCYAVPYGCCGSQGTPACIGEPGCAGMAADELGFIVWRNYLDPVSKTGADPAEVIFDHAIKFCPSDVSCSTVAKP